jgi:hypothetical protein
MIKGNLLLDVKRLFLSFAQAVFSNNIQFRWDPDLKKTDIIIVDRNAVDLGVVVKRPTIVLQRGAFSWMYAVRGQDGTNAVGFNDKFLADNTGYPNTIRSKVYTDLLRCTLSFFCLAKDGIQAEIIANHLFIALTAARDDFRKLGVQNITGLSMSEEQIVKQSSTLEYSGIQIQIGFTIQPTITVEDRLNNCYIYIDNDLFSEQTDYSIEDLGTKVVFKEIPSETPKIDYIDAITLETVNAVNLVPTADTKEFLVPDGQAIAGFYKILNNIELDITQ